MVVGGEETCQGRERGLKRQERLGDTWMVIEEDLVLT